MAAAFFHFTGPFDAMSCATTLLAPDMPAAVNACAVPQSRDRRPIHYSGCFVALPVPCEG